MGSGDARLTVVRANPRELGHHMGLLVRIESTLPDSFVSPWRTAEPLLSPKLAVTAADSHADKVTSLM
jgi:hypothetical protein